METNTMQELINAIKQNNHMSVFDTICRDRLFCYSVFTDDKEHVEIHDNLKAAKLAARKMCKDTNKRVTVCCHNPFETWREYIIVHYAKKLKWFYVHVNALSVKHI